MAQGDTKIEKCSAERVWTNILTKPLQSRAFREFIGEVMIYLLEYKGEITCEYVGKITGVSDTNVVQAGKHNARYR